LPERPLSIQLTIAPLWWLLLHCFEGDREYTDGFYDSALSSVISRFFSTILFPTGESLIQRVPPQRDPTAARVFASSDPVLNDVVFHSAASGDLYKLPFPCLPARLNLCEGRISSKIVNALPISAPNLPEA